MNRYLTRGGKAIPKLIAYDAQTREPVFSWGPRPAPAQEMFWRMHDAGVPHADIVEVVQKWYNEDRSMTLQKEFPVLAEEKFHGQA